MAIFSWDDTLSVKVRQFDDQHKKLVDLINQLHDAMKVGKGKDVLGKTLKSLADYTQSHFTAEELLMRQHNYPNFEKHKKEHNQLILQVSDLQKKLQEGSMVLSQEVFVFLKEWVVKHIQVMDKEYGPYLHSKGVI